jgi:hypothetical protein
MAPSFALLRVPACGAFVAALGIVLIVPPTHAAQPQPGQWRVVTKTTIAGLPPGVPAGMGAQEHTQTQCITPEQAKDPGKNWQRPDAPRGNQNCTNKNAWNGNVLTIDSTCAGNPPATVKGTITFDSPTHYKGVMNSASSGGGMAMQVTVTMEGQRIGECPK